MTIGKIKRVPLREVWKHEAHNFTTWLQENTDALSDVLDFTLSGVERERSAGDFNVDLVGEDEQGRTVVIENQLEKSDHDHLGKVLTYLAALDAGAAVWIVARPRQEHIKAVTWLNEATSTPFYLVQVEAIRIGESLPAALFTKIVGPSVEARQAGQTKKDLDERKQVRRGFWTQLLDHAKTKTKLHGSNSPGTADFLGTTIGGFQWCYSVRKHDAQAELYIDTGDGERNLRAFDKLHEKKEKVEMAFGGPLEWQRLDSSRACRIRQVVNVGGWLDEEKWPELIEALVESMIRLEKALEPHVKPLRQGA
jgi:hypothetical protein